MRSLYHYSNKTNQEVRSPFFSLSMIAASLELLMTLHERSSFMKIRSLKEARSLIDQLPENSTWDDLMYEIYVRQAVEAGLLE